MTQAQYYYDRLLFQKNSFISNNFAALLKARLIEGVLILQFKNDGLSCFLEAFELSAARQKRRKNPMAVKMQAVPLGSFENM